MDDQVDVLRHEYIRPQIEIEGVTGLVDAFNEPLACPDFREKRESMIARPCKFVSVAGFLLIPAVSLGLFWLSAPPPRSQGHPLRS